MSDPVIYRFQPDAMNEEILDKLLVGKRDFLNIMRKEIEKAAKNKTPRYYLILGARGIGKSHFLTLLYYKTRNLDGVTSVKLSEEEYSVYRVSDLFLRILEEIKNEPLDGKFQKDDMVVEEVLENLKDRNKMILIFMENLNQIFGEQLEKKEVKKLRTIFQENDIFIVVATSPLIFPEISHGGEPLYNFFDIKHMHELNEEEVKELIRILHDLEGKSQDLELYYERVDTVIKLTGGSPRIVILLYDLMSKGRVLDIEEAFFKILDEYTPYYQDLFKLLTKQRRRIFDVLISLEKPATPKKIAETARLGNNVVVTQLRRLEKDGYVISRRQGKNVKYEVRERLFRMWRELRQPFGKKRFKIFIEFYTLWYTHAEREEMLGSIMGNLDIVDNELIRKAEYLFWTLPEESKKRFIPEIERKCREIGMPELLREFFESEDKKLRTVFKSRESEISEGKTKDFMSLFDEGKYKDILKEVEKIDRKSEKNETILSWKGVALVGLQKYEEALQVFDGALKINPENAEAWYNKGVALGNLGKYEEEITCYDEALRINPQDAKAWYNKGVALGNLGKYEETIICYDEALRINPQYAKAWYNKGVALGNLGKYEEEITCYDEALRINPQYAKAWLNKGVALGNLGKYEEEITCYDEILKINPQYAKAWYNKGVALGNLGKYEETIICYDEALRINPRILYAWYNKGVALGNLGKYEEEIICYDEALRINPHYVKAWSNKGVALGNLGKYEEEITCYDEILKINPQYVIAWYKKGAVCLNIAAQESKKNNYGNVVKNINSAMDSFLTIWDTQEKEIKEIILSFIKGLANSKQIKALETSLSTILEKKNDLKPFLKPVLTALEIVKTKNLKTYYDFQIEERDIIVDIVKKLNDSEDIIPKEYRKRSKN
ncbi:MAG: tetratricopeptide repeat protein [Candidatus Methanofastidiosia archaeon]|jgi:hypothetical protein